MKAYTKQDVKKMLDTGYFRFPKTPFWDGVDMKDVDSGTHALWKSVPTGRHGGQITKTELFHGECRGWQNGFVTLS